MKNLLQKKDLISPHADHGDQGAEGPGADNQVPALNEWFHTQEAADGDRR